MKVDDWVRDYVSEEDDDVLRHLQNCLREGYDVREQVREHAVRRWFPGAWSLSAAASYEARSAPRPEALELLKKVRRTVCVVRDWELGDSAPMQVELVDSVVRVVEEGRRFTGVVVRVKFEGLPDRLIAWSAE